MRWRKSDWILLAIVLSSGLIGVTLYPYLPEQIAVHFNISGEPDDFAGKNFAVFFFPFFNAALFFLMIWLPRLDPKRENYQRFAKSYTVVRWALMLFLVMIHLFILYYAWAEEQNLKQIDISDVVPLTLGLLYVIIGNYLTQARQNYFFGIRTPWTLENETVWRKTHRLGGRLFVLSGIAAMASVLLPEIYRFAVVVGGILLSSIVTIIYSYLIFRKEKA